MEYSANTCNLLCEHLWFPTWLLVDFHLFVESICFIMKFMNEESSIREEWDNIPLPEVQPLVSSVPRCLQMLLKEEGMLRSGKH